jgi:predicted RecA/RadA family phage recombinase
MRTNIILHDPKPESLVMTAAVSPGEIIATPDGYAAIVGGFANAAIGDRVPVELDVVAEVPAASATTFTVGDLIRWNNTTKLAVASGAGDFSIGYAVLAKTNGQTIVRVRFNKLKLPTASA